MDDLYLCTSLSDGEAAASTGERLCHMDYLLNREGVLLRSGTGTPSPGNLLALCGPETVGSADLDPDPLCAWLASECERRGAGGLLCDFEGGADEFRIRLCRRLSDLLGELGLRLYLPEVFAPAAPEAIRLISSAVVGEPCGEAFRRAALRYGAGRTALLCEPLSGDYALPLRGPASPREGVRLRSDALAALMAREHAVGYFSQELCARYFTYRDGEHRSRFVIYDDPASLRRKITLAKNCGIREAFLCTAHYTAELRA